MTHSVHDRGDRVGKVDVRPIVARPGTVDGAIPLARLLSVVTLTPPQAAYLARRILDLDDAHLPDLVVGADGELSGRDGAPSAAPDHLAALLTQLARNADRPAARHRPEHRALLDAVQHSAELIKSDGPAAGGGPLTQAPDGREHQHDVEVRAELAALVAAITGRRLGLPSGGAAPYGVAPVVNGSAPSALAVASNGQTVAPRDDAGTEPQPILSRRRWFAAGIGVALVALASGLIVLLSGGSSAPNGVGTPSHPAASQPIAAGNAPVTHAHHSAVMTTPSLGPRAAGPVRGVSIAPSHACRAGRTCQVTVTVHMRQSSTRRQVAWYFTVVNRCTGARSNAPGGQLTVEPGWTRPYETTTVHLPSGRALAVVALTRTPAAASAPLLVPASGATC